MIKPYTKTFAAVASVLMLVTPPVATQAQFLGISLGLDVSLPAPPLVAIAPPALPVYIVPSPPVEGVIWQPGYWHWGLFGYYWVPGVWVNPPAPAMLWTPGYWGWGGGNFAWHEGYWGPHVGFYGGINYGGGYGGSGFNGGSWNHGNYIVNRSVTNVTNIRNVTINNYNGASFNGGPGGTAATPNAQERMAMNEHHMPPTSEQVNHIKAAGNNPQLRASANGGKPSIAATSRPGVFNGAGVVAARQAGPRNAMAEQHNQAVMSNPSLSHGAAVPKADGNESRAGFENHQQPAQYPSSAHNRPMDNAAHRVEPEQQPHPQEHNSPAHNVEPKQAHPAEHPPEEHEGEHESEEHREPGER